MNSGMSRSEFRKYGKETVDYIADYLETIHKRRVVPAIEPGYLKASNLQDKLNVHAIYLAWSVRRTIFYEI